MLSPIIATSEGMVQGVVKHLGPKQIFNFLGIPFAKPPVGKLRFQKPESPDFRVGLYQATRVKPECLSATGLKVSAPGTSEDCLYLNILVPTKGIRELLFEKKLPVILFIPGGGFNVQGGTETPYLNPVLPAFEDVILVTINYRTNLFGFVYHEQYRKEFFGNLGFYDQNVAIRWVKKNIARFGGDPDNITIYGHSAGSMSISAHLISPYSRGLVRKAIMSSGTGIIPQSSPNLRTSLATEVILRKSGCIKSNHKVGCLQSLNSTYLLSLIPEVIFPFLPTFESEYIPVRLDQVFLDENFPPNDVDLLIGVTRHDGSLFVAIKDPDAVTAPEVSYTQALRIISTVFKEKGIPDVTNWYLNSDVHRVSSPSEVTRQALIKIFTDIFTACPSWEISRRLRKYQRRGKTFAYLLDYKATLSYIAICNQNPNLGICHGDDLTLVFGSPFWQPMNFTDQDRRASLEMIRTWGQFARTG